MLWQKNISLALALLGGSFFVGIVAWQERQALVSKPEVGLGRVVISSPILAALYGGDRFLAANLETMRLAATSTDDGVTDSHYLIRAQLVVSELNACHEDNYYLANGLLTWGGAVAEGNEILRRAMDCRFWDGVPSFFYGVNRSFFDRDITEAVRAFELSAERWPENASSFRRMAIMLHADNFNDAKLALDYLQRQRDSTRDARLRDMLSQRVSRLEGLLDLRAAQQRYERVHGPLTDLQELVISGVLDTLPEDPLQLGYELRNGTVELAKLQILGIEE